MFQLFVIWFISFLIIFFLQINITTIYYRNINNNSYTKLNINNQYNEILNTNNFFSSIFTELILFIILGYFLESKFKISKRILYYFEKKSLISNIKYQYRIFIPLFVLEVPILFIMLIIKIKSLHFFIGIFIGQFLNIYSLYKNTIEMDLPDKEDESFIRNINNNLLSKKASLNMGQIYSRILLPYLFFILPFLVPLFIKEIFYIIPNYDLNKINIIGILSFIVILSNYFLIKDNFYFYKINIYNFTFILIKNILCFAIVIVTIYFKYNLYLFFISIILTSFIITWHPHKLR